MHENCNNCHFTKMSRKNSIKNGKKKPIVGAIWGSTTANSTQDMFYKI